MSIHFLVEEKQRIERLLDRVKGEKEREEIQMQYDMITFEISAYMKKDINTQVIN